MQPLERRHPWRLRLLYGLIFLLGVLTLIILTSLLYSAHAVPESQKGIWHKVRPGDTVWDLGKHYGVSHRLILQANRLRNPRRLYVGKRLFIPGASVSGSAKEVWHVVQRGDTLWDLARHYKVKVRDIENANRGLSAKRLYVGRRLRIPAASGVRYRFGRPLDRTLVLTSGYGYRIHPISRRRKFHHGADFRAATGTPVLAAADGQVIFVGYYGGYGKTVMVRHSNGYVTRYGHLSRILVPHGRKVERGQWIGRTGNTGYSTGPHLHFEIRRYGKSINPLPEIQGWRRAS